MSELTPERLAELRGLAAAVAGRFCPDDKSSLFRTGRYDEIAFIAATNPLTVLALLDEVERLRGDTARLSDEWNRLAETSRAALAESEQRVAELEVALGKLLRLLQVLNACQPIILPGYNDEVVPVDWYDKAVIGGLEIARAALTESGEEAGDG